ANRIANNVAGVAGPRSCRTRTLKASATALPATSSTSGRAAAAARSLSSLLSGLACAAGGAESHYSLTQERRVAAERFIDRFVGFLVPPGKYRIVTVVERVPVAQISPQPGDCIYRTEGDGLFNLDCVRIAAA